MIGLYPSYLRPEKKPTRAGEDRRYYILSISKGQWLRNQGDWNRKIQNSFFKFNGDIFFRVRDIETKKYDGIVYNMEIEEDNSYVSGFQAVHNCITGIEAQYAGVPVICNRYAGVTTTFKHPELGDTAIMLGNGDAWWPYSKEGREVFLAETVLILKDKARWQEWSNRGKENAKRFSWARVAQMWDEEFKK